VVVTTWRRVPDIVGSITARKENLALAADADHIRLRMFPHALTQKRCPSQTRGEKESTLSRLEILPLGLPLGKNPFLLGGARELLVTGEKSNGT